MGISSFNSIMLSVCGLLACIFCMRAVGFLLQVKNGAWANILLFIACFLFIYMVIYVGDWVNLPGALVPIFLAILICCKGSLMKKSSIFMVLASMGMSFNAAIDSYSKLNNIGYILRMLLWLGVLFMLKKITSGQEINLSAKMWGMMDLLALTPFSAMLITILLREENFTEIDFRDVVMLVVIFITSFGLLWAVVVLARQRRLEQEQRFYQLNQAYYKSLEQEQFQIRRLRHDMGNHLQAMYALPDQEMREYLQQMLESPAMERSARFCENNVINAVLAAKQLRMEEAGIQTEISVVLPSSLPIGEVDLCAVFANSLDNAIEACEKVSPGQRSIQVKSRADKGMLMLQVINSTGEDVKKSANGLFATTKRDQSRHGFGLASMQEIARRYGGTMELMQSNRRFEMMICLPLAK